MRTGVTSRRERRRNNHRWWLVGAAPMLSLMTVVGAFDPSVTPTWTVASAPPSADGGSVDPPLTSEPVPPTGTSAEPVPDVGAADGSADVTTPSDGSDTSSPPVDSSSEGVPDTSVDTSVGADGTPIDPPTESTDPEPDAPALPVVPGLAGWGVDTPAGRGGEIIAVTNLDDDGPGSLRAALAAEGPRIIVFEVGGTIQLQSRLVVLEPFVTLAGQTAPDPGITLAGYHLSIRTHDVLVQHIRVRPGDINGGDPEGISIYQPGGHSVHHVVIDHTSTSWAIDENTNTWSATAADPGPDAGVHDVTFSNNVIAEALNFSTHPKGDHSKGMLIGDGSERVTVVRNVFANNADRSPEMTGGTSTAVVNNVIYGWDPKQEATHFGRAGSVADEPTCSSVVGNVYLRSALMRQFEAAAIEIHRELPPGSKIYLASNISPSLIAVRNESPLDPFVSSPPMWPAGLVAAPGWIITETVLGSAGARPASRDAVDTRVIADVYAGTGRIIDTQAQVGGWPESPETHRPLELPDDPHGDDDDDGYTNVEEWLHDWASLVETGRRVVAEGWFDPLPMASETAPGVAECS